MRVVVHQDRCVGAGNCVSVAPAVFDQGEDDGIVVLLLESPTDELVEAVRRAVHLCPASAIVVHES